MVVGRDDVELETRKSSRCCVDEGRVDKGEETNVVSRAGSEDEVDGGRGSVRG